MSDERMLLRADEAIFGGLRWRYRLAMDSSLPPWIAAVSADDRDVMKACLRAAVDGPFFPEWEFATLFGLERDEVRDVLLSWPEAADRDLQFNAVNNAFGDLLGYPHGRDDVWGDFIPVDREQLRDLFWRMRELRGANDHNRAFLAVQLQQFTELTDAELARKTKLVRDVMLAAERYGVDVPNGLQERLGANPEHPEQDG